MLDMNTILSKEITIDDPIKKITMLNKELNSIAHENLNSSGTYNEDYLLKFPLNNSALNKKKGFIFDKNYESNPVNLKESTPEIKIQVDTSKVARDSYKSSLQDYNFSSNQIAVELNNLTN